MPLQRPLSHMASLRAFTGLIAIIPVSVPGSCIQSGGSAIIFVILGLVPDKIGFKRRFSHWRRLNNG